MVRRSTWLLLAALAVSILGYLAWQRSAETGSDIQPESPPEFVWSVLAEDVRAVRVVDLVAGRVFVVRREAETGWRMVAPAIAEADAGRVEAAVAGVLSPSIRQSLPESDDLAAYGLAPAAYRVSLFLSDGTVKSIDVGSLDPTGSVYYVQAPGDPRILMITRFSLEDLLGLVAEPPLVEPTATPMDGTVVP